MIPRLLMTALALLVAWRTGRPRFSRGRQCATPMGTYTSGPEYPCPSAWRHRKRSPTRRGSSQRQTKGALCSKHCLVSDKEGASPVRSEVLLSPDAPIPDRRTFAEFLYALAHDVRTRPERWQRTDLATYLEVIAPYAVNDIDAFHRNWRGTPAPDPPTWRLMADLLSAGRSAYEDWHVEP